MTATKTNKIQQLKEQAVASIQQFTDSEDAYGKMLHSIIADVERASKESLEIFPVSHHSPSSGLFMVKRLREKKPKVIFLELCEDMQPIIENLKECKFPVALQAFSLETEGFPTTWTPLNVIAPITEKPAGTKESEQKEEAIHGSAVGVQMGNLRPSFKEFETFLLKNANVNHYSEWWEKYIEESLVGASYDSYRQVFFFIGSLFRRLRQNKARYEIDCQRERYMWQRMKTYLSEHASNPADGIYICGAFHAVSDIPEFGIESKVIYSIPKKSKSKWLYGIIPSSYFGIELLETTTNELSTNLDALYTFLGKQPSQHQEDTVQLTNWCANIVRLARKNGYMATSADSISIFQTSILLANLRNRTKKKYYPSL